MPIDVSVAPACPGAGSRHATRVCQLRHYQMEQPTEPHARRSRFLLSFGGVEGGYYWVASDTGPNPTENHPCQTLVACLAGSR